jgi:hypothetical protein
MNKTITIAKLRSDLSGLFFKDDAKHLADELREKLKNQKPTNLIIRKAFFNLELLTSDIELKSIFTCVICHGVVYDPR